MSFWDTVYALAKDNGITVFEITKRLGLSPAYIAVQRSRGSHPKTNTAAQVLDAVGYELWAVPSGSRMPEGSLKID